MKRQVFVSVVLYISDDSDGAIDLVRRLDCYLGERFEMLEIIVVDDGSDDEAGDKVVAQVESLSHPLVVVRLARHYGVEAAMLAGLQRSMGDFVFELESSRPEFELSVLMDLYETASRGTDIVAASGPAVPFWSRLFFAVVNRYADLGVPLSTEKVRIVSRRALSAMLGLRERVLYRKALYAITGYPYAKQVYEVPADRQSGSRSLDRNTVAQAADILISFSRFSQRAPFWLAVVFGSFSLLAGLYAVMVFVFRSGVVSGWTTVMLLLSMGFCGVFLSIGLIGAYVSNVLTEVRARPLFAIRTATVANPGWRDRDDTHTRRAVSPYFEAQLRGGDPSRRVEPVAERTEKDSAEFDVAPNRADLRGDLAGGGVDAANRDLGDAKAQPRCTDREVDEQLIPLEGVTERLHPRIEEQASRVGPERVGRVREPEASGEGDERSVNQPDRQ